MRNLLDVIRGNINNWLKPGWKWKNKEQCTCNDWKEGIDNLYAITISAKLHGMECSVKPFKFCPWCGKLSPIISN